MSKRIQERISVALCILGFIILVLLWTRAAQGRTIGGPPAPTKVIWLDAAAVAHQDGDRVLRGVMRKTAPGAAGVPVVAVPPPLRRPGTVEPACAWTQGGSFRDANGWWHETVDGPRRGSICIWNGPPPLEPCLPPILGEERNGYECLRGATHYPSGAGCFWNPVRQTP